MFVSCIDWVNGLAANRRQAITRTIDDTVDWRIHVSPDSNEFLICRAEIAGMNRKYVFEIEVSCNDIDHLFTRPQGGY